MFTGIVEDTAAVAAVAPAAGGGGLLRYRFAPSQVDLSTVAMGESIAIDGCCLTVVAWDDSTFEVEASPETLSKTTLGQRRPGDRVNLERALRVGDRLGGHLVTGHVDLTGEMRRRTEAGNGSVLEFSMPSELAPYMVAKGSIAVDGVSLTVNEVRDDAGVFTVFLIPHTLEVTTLGLRKAGDRVNLETDLLGKYVLRALGLRGSKAETGVDEEFLARHGWI